MISKVRQNKYQAIFTAIIYLLIILTYFFLIKASFVYHPDIARDLNDIINIAKGDLSLIGPKLSFFGIYAGPYYYYSLLPLFVLSRYHHLSLVVTNISFYIFSLIYLYYKLRKKHTDFAILAVLLIGLSPLFIIHARSPWNGSSYIPLLLILFTSLFYKKKISLFQGILSGIILQYHPITLVTIIPFLLIFTIKHKPDKKSFLSYILGLFISFLPLLAFELKNNFIMTSSINFSTNYSSIGKTSLLSSLSLTLADWNLVYTLTLLISIFQLKNKNEYLSKIVLLSFILTILANLYQPGHHYSFSLHLLFLFYLVNALIQSRHKSVLFIFFIFLNVLFFPKKAYSPSTRTIDYYKQITNRLVENEVINHSQPFNLIYLSKDYGYHIVNANEFKFLFKKDNYPVQDFAPHQLTSKLILISEIPNFNLDQFSCWELEQFLNQTKTKPDVKLIDNHQLKIYQLNLSI